MTRIWEYTDSSKKLKFVIEEDLNVGFYLIVYPLDSNKSIKDHLCDDFDEACYEASESYGVSSDAWVQK